MPLGIGMGISPVFGGGLSYIQRVLATDPIAYWVLGERAGNVARCQVLAAQNGQHVGVTLGQPGIGDGNTCPYYDGTNDYTNVQTATLAGRFNGAEGTVIVWMRVANAGVWTDGQGREMIRVFVNANNHVRISKAAINNSVFSQYVAGGVTKTVQVANTSLANQCFGATWSSAADEFRLYIDGVPVGVTQTILGAWVGVPVVSVIGASSIVPAAPWHGWLAHVPLWNRALAPAEMADLYRP